MHQISSSSLPLELHPSKARIVLLLLVSTTFVAIGISLIPTQPVIAYGNIALFGLGVAVFLLQLHPKCSYLILRTEGFTFCALFRKHGVRWQDTKAFVPVRIGMNTLVGWSYASTFHARDRLRELNQALAGVDAALPDNYGLRPEDLANLLNHLRSQSVLAPDA